MSSTANRLVTSVATTAAKKVVRAGLQSVQTVPVTVDVTSPTGTTRPVPMTERPDTLGHAATAPVMMVGPPPSSSTNNNGRLNKLHRKTRPPTGNNRYARLLPEDQAGFKQFRSRAKWLDGKHTCCCCLSCGLDPLLGLIPVIGDFAGVFLSVMLLQQAMRQWKLPQHLITRMVVNIIIDALIGLVPVIGDLADFMFKCNMKNSDLLEEHLVQRAQQAQHSIAMV